MEEDAAEIPLSGAGRLLAEFRAERDQRREAEAKTAGFSSWDEYDKYLIEESRKLDEERERKLDEKCALLGQTWEELYAEDPQRFIPDDGGLPGCDCHDHPIPFFCSKSLVEYQSIDQSDWLRYVDNQKKVQTEDLKVERDDTSRRLDQKDLERAWGVQSPDTSRDVPFWAKEDKVIRQIIDSRSPSPVLRHFTSMNRPITPASPPSSDIELADAATTPSTANMDLLRIVPLHNEQTSPSTKDAQISELTASEKAQQRTNSKGIRRSPSSKVSRLRRVTGTNTRIQKAIRKSPAMATRSQKVAKYHQLDPTGVAIALGDG